MASGRRQYPFHLIEPKWQNIWDQQQIFRAWNPGETIPGEHPFAQRHRTLPPKFYILDMFPYPSGAGLHVGHPEGYTATDILARYKRAAGFNVLHPMGWDAFGLPAEQYAIRTGQHPRQTTEANIATFKRQIKSLGFSYDWSREVDTTDPQYFKWTQWIFLKLYNAWFNPKTNRAEHIETLPCPAELKTEQEKRTYRDSKRLAYVAEMPVWWCEELGTVLANEEVVDGKSEVGGFPVVRKPMRQWMLRITAYAERLLHDLNTIDWSDSLKEMQRNWIGRSGGAEVDFEVVAAVCDRRTGAGTAPLQQSTIRVFTTRPDTLFGATYMVLAPEHKLVDQITTPEQRASIQAYKAQVTKKSDLERTELAKEKTGVFTGAFAINPVNNERIPVWIADYVLTSYGTGAIMAVPAHDERDFEFARKFRLPIKAVVLPPEGDAFKLELKEDGPFPLPWEELAKRYQKSPEIFSEAFCSVGTSVNCTGPEVSITGLPTPEAKKKITAWLEENGLGRLAINYKLRDWLFSRQRYWGEPFPIVWKRDGSGNLYHASLPESALPVLPPPLDDYKPTPDGQPPLARAKDWVENVPGIPGATRELNTMPQWAGSCWYYLRYLDARRSESFCGVVAEHYWMGMPTEGLLLRPEQWAARLSEIYAYALTHPPAGKQYVTFAIVGAAEANLIRAETGLDVAGYRRSLDDQAISHILAEHGDEKTEAARGQLPVTFADLLLIPDVVSHPDRVLHDRRTGTGLEAILYEKQINGFICCVEEVRTKHQLLAVKTLFKRRTTAAHASNGFDHTSETLRRSGANKTSSGPEVKPTPGIDLYVGGTEHAVLHLLYARFWHKVLFDLGYVSTPEPFFKLVNQGLILGELEFFTFAKSGRVSEGFVTSEKIKDIKELGAGLVGVHKETGETMIGLKLAAREHEVEKRGEYFCLKAQPAIRVEARSFKMSKSRGNVINPDDILVEYGADAFRLYEMFMGPLEMVKPWNTKGVEGVYRFLGRVWRLFVDEQSETEFEQAETVTTKTQRHEDLLSLIKLGATIKDVPANPAQLKALHACIKKVTEDFDGLRFNTAISALMVFVNEAMTWEVKPHSVLREFLILLQPLAPHLAEELWAKLNSSFVIRHSSLPYALWPTFDPALLVEDTLEIPVQVNGKLRDVIKVPATATQAELEAAAKASEKVQQFIAGKTIKKIFVVPKKLVNIAVG